MSVPCLLPDWMRTRWMIPGCKGFLNVYLQSIMYYEALGKFARLYPTDCHFPLLLTLQQYLKREQLLEGLQQGHYTRKFPRPEMERAKINKAQCFHHHFPSFWKKLRLFRIHKQFRDLRLKHMHPSKVSQAEKQNCKVSIWDKYLPYLPSLLHFKSMLNHKK